MRQPTVLLAAALVILLAASASAHPLQTGYLELRSTGSETYAVLWTMPTQYGLAPDIGIVLDERCTSVTPPAEAVTPRRFVRSWTVRCAGGIAGARINATRLGANQSDLLLRVVEDGAELGSGRLTPTAPSWTVPPSRAPAAVVATYLSLGVEHILLGIDHLLLVAVLVLLVPGWRRLMVTITAFTAAHSLTLAAAVLGLVHLPQPPVEALIAFSIALVAAEVLRPRGGRPWRLAFAFGLLHGLGFAGALTEVGLPPGAVPAALLGFNLGVELGQLAFVAVLLTLLAAARRLPLPKPSWARAVAPYAIGSLAMLWTIERIAAFWG